MPNFFDLTNLPEEKASRWNEAVLTYERIREKNIDRELAAMTTAQKESLFETFPKKTFTAREALALSHATQGGEGNPKSALFARLLNGAKPLILPPPLYFGYPWYDIFDNKEVHEIHVRIDRSAPTARIFIGDFHWEFASQEKPGCWTLSTGGWAALTPPVTWRLKHTRIAAEACKAYIASWHNPTIQRITNLKQLEEEVKWHVNQKYQSIKAVYGATPEEILLVRNKSLHCESIRQKKIDTDRLNLLQQGLYWLTERRKKGLSYLPDPDEKSRDITSALAGYFKKSAAEGHYEVDGDGNLWRRSWSIERLSSPVYRRVAS